MYLYRLSNFFVDLTLCNKLLLYTVSQEVTPQISMPNQSKGKSPYDDEPSPESKKESPTKPKPKQASPEKSTSTGWFGGIFSKISLKPKNQMKLPDDKNPKVSITDL